MSAPSIDHTRDVDDVLTEYVSVSEAGRLLGISVDTVRLRFDAGQLDGYRTPSNQRRISRASITAMVEVPR